MRNIAFITSCLVLSSACLAQTWTQIRTKTSPAHRWSHAAAYDPVRARTVIFGGSGISIANRNDTWVYDGKNWTQLQPNTSPSGRRMHKMVHAGTRTVMFGGASVTGSYLAETWIWDGKDWTQVKTANSPSPRGIGALAYDSARKVVVLFGGLESTGVVNDTWEFDFKNWTRVTTKNTPSKRYSNLVYDAVRKRVVMFGGVSTGFLDDTWEYDGKDWKEIHPATKPSARAGVGMAYDASRQRTVLFGGISSGGRFNDTWEYDGLDWKQVKTPGQPAARYDFDCMVYDSRRQRMVLFGGSTTSSPRQADDTWEYVGPQPLTGSPATISIATGGTYTFSLDAGAAQGNRLYWIFGSVTGTSPGVTLKSLAGSVTLPLTPDLWTDLTIALANTSLLTKTRAGLDATGKASATLNLPRFTNQSAIGLKLYHAFLVYDARNNFHMASNAAELTLVK